MKIILCGYHWAGCKALEILLSAGHHIFVYTHESPYYVADMVAYCEEKKIPYSTKNISKTKLPFKPDVIASVYYRYIIKPHIIEACNGKIFNLHPSQLPDYKGCSSLTWAMINGEKSAGFTYHYIDPAIDTGNIILQKAIPIEDFDTQLTLYNRAMFEALNYFPEVLEKVVDGYVGTPQPEGGQYYRRGCPHDGEIDPSWSETYTRRFVRAMINPPLPVAKSGNREIFKFKDLGSIKK